MFFLQSKLAPQPPPAIRTRFIYKNGNLSRSSFPTYHKIQTNLLDITYILTRPLLSTHLQQFLTSILCSRKKREKRDRNHSPSVVGWTYISSFLSTECSSLPSDDMTKILWRFICVFLSPVLDNYIDKTNSIILFVAFLCKLSFLGHSEFLKKNPWPSNFTSPGSKSWPAQIMFNRFFLKEWNESNQADYVASSTS